MSYIGTPPSNAFTSLLKQDFSTSATTGYTLDHAVNNANDIALFINFVRQEPTAGYAASGTTLTLTSATASSDDMYCVYLGQALQTVNPANASVGLSQLTATGTKNSTTFLRGDNTFASAGANTPAFLVRNTANQTFSNVSTTQIIFNNEVFDTNSAFASNVFTVPSGEGGKYFFYFRFTYDNPNETGYRVVYIKKTGSTQAETQNLSIDVDQYTITGSALLDCSVGDFIGLDFYQSSGGNLNSLAVGGVCVQFGGFKLIT